MKNPDCVGIGDMLFVLRASGFDTLERAPALECVAGSAEPNVLIGLARLGLAAGLISKVTDNFIGRWLRDTVRGLGVDVGGVRMTAAGRVGIMYVERGVPPRPSRVVYDRRQAAITTLRTEDVDWDYLARARAVYLSGITPALGERCRRVAHEAAACARDHGRQLVFDLNYRSQLWTPRQACAFLDTFLGNVDVCFVKAADAKTLFQLPSDPDRIGPVLQRRFGIPLVVVSCGADGAVAFDSDRHAAAAYPTQVLSRFGVGDAFIAGVLSVLLRQGQVAEALRTGCAAAALKATIPNVHFPLITREQVERLMTEATAADGAMAVLR